MDAIHNVHPMEAFQPETVRPVLALLLAYDVLALNGEVEGEGQSRLLCKLALVVTLCTWTAFWA